MKLPLELLGINKRGDTRFELHCNMHPEDQGGEMFVRKQLAL
jgi:hypothetical protein